MKKIIFIAHDPGGYDVIFPVVQKLQQQSVALNFYCVGPAARQNASYSASEVEIGQKIYSLLHNESLLGLVTGTSWGNDFELQLTAACKAAKVPTISILDYWANYQTRFKNKLGQFVYPDYYIVMDSIAAQEAVQAGVPSGIIKALGHPGLDQYIGLPRKQSASTEKKKILFLSQPLSVLYGNDLGYTEQQVIADCIRVLGGNDNYTFHIKFHPKDDANFQQQYSDFAVQGNVTELISAHDVIIGMNTMGLLHAVLMGIPSISYQPNLCRADMCITNKLGLTKLIHSYNELKNLFDSDTIAQNSKNIYNQDNLIWVDGLSTERVAGFIREVLLYEN